MDEGQKEIEKELLKGIFQYDHKAWEKFIDVYGKAIYYTIYKTVCGKGIRIPMHDHDDLYQDFLLSLIENNSKKLRSFKFLCSLKTFLIILARNFTLNWAHKIINRPQPQVVDEELEGVLNILQDPRQGPGEVFEEKEREHLIQDFLKTLDPFRKDIFILFFLEGKTHKDIIHLKGIPRATAYRKTKEIEKDFLTFYHSRI